MSARIIFNGQAIDAGEPRKAPRKRVPAKFSREQAFALISALDGASSKLEASAIIRRTGVVLTGRWRTVMLNLADALLGVHKGPVIFAKGNAKLPFYAFSALPFATCPGMGACKSFCYSLRSWRTPEPFARQVYNTLLLRFDREAIARAFRKLPYGVTVRLYVDGDFDSLTTIDMWMGLMREREDIQAYGYSKSWDILWAWGQRNEWPSNYALNISNGGVAQVSREAMMSLPITRGQFLAVPVTGISKRAGHKRYDDPAYHQAVRSSALAMGLGKVFSCPGRCGQCASGEHACGNSAFKGVVIAIGIH